jgi:hypothetical protein
MPSKLGHQCATTQKNATHPVAASTLNPTTHASASALMRAGCGHISKSNQHGASYGAPNGTGGFFAIHRFTSTVG